MTFNSRQFEEIYGLVEVSVSPSFTPGAVGNNAVAGSTQACVINGTTTASQAVLGDIVDVVAPASAALNGLLVEAAPTATPGTLTFSFTNTTGGSITPIAAVYKVIIRRVRPDINF
jgi:hypothetical protein